ncbi:MAG: hypothetical protein H7Y59_00325 [Anaerolineales bacterium]|nr:hypothetical protein [Anaerolineales bacterium]
MFNIVIMVVLAAILVTILGGFIMSQQTMPASDKSMGRSTNPLIQPESAQSGPTGTLVMSTGILLLLVGFGVLVVVLWAKRNSPHGNSS